MQRLALTKDFSPQLLNPCQSRLGLTGAVPLVLSPRAASHASWLAGPDAGQVVGARSGFVLGMTTHGHRSMLAFTVNHPRRLAFPKNIPNMVGS